MTLTVLPKVDVQTRKAIPMPKKSPSSSYFADHKFSAMVLSKTKSQRNPHPIEIDAERAIENTTVNGQKLGRLLTPLLATIAKEAKRSRLPSEFAQKFFQILTDTLGLTSACLRQVAGPEPELRFVHFRCNKAKDEPRVFGIELKGNTTPNIIVNATIHQLPIVDGNQSHNENNKLASLGKTPDKGSIFSYPFTDELRTRWLFTSCQFERLDAFSDGHLSFLHILFPIFCANYNALAFKEACNLAPQFAHALDIQRHEVRRTRIRQLLEPLEYDMVFLVTLHEGKEQVIDHSQINWQFFDGNEGDSFADTREGKELIWKVASENPQSSFTVSRVRDQLVFSCRDNLAMEPIDAPASWQLGRYVAMIPIDLGNNERFAYVWVECKSQPKAEVLFEIDQKRDSYEADIRAVRGLLPFRDYGEDAMAEESLTLAIEHAVQQPNEPVLIEGPHGTGKLYYARQIHAKLFPPNNDASVSMTPGNYHVLSPLAKSKTVLELLDKPGVVVFYRADEFKRKLQIELLRIVSELELPDGKPLKAKLVFLLSTSDFIGEDSHSNNAVAGLHSRLRNSCVYIKLKDLIESSERIPDLIKHHLKNLKTTSGESLTVNEDVVNDFKRYMWEGNLPQLHRALREMQRKAGDAKELNATHYPDWFVRPGAEIDNQELVRGWFIFEKMLDNFSVENIREMYFDQFKKNMPNHQNTYKSMAVRAAIEKGRSFAESVKVANIKESSDLGIKMNAYAKRYEQRKADAPSASQRSSRE
jgi:hypothetical protein